MLKPEHSRIGEYHGCWRPGSLSYQVISNHGIDPTGWTGPCQQRERILTTCTIWNIRENIFMFHNPLRSIQNSRHFADDIVRCIFLNEDIWISFKISLKFVPKLRSNNIPALDQITTWRRSGAKPLSESMMVILPTHICVTRPHWIKTKCSTTTIANKIFIIPMVNFLYKVSICHFPCSLC